MMSAEAKGAGESNLDRSSRSGAGGRARVETDRGQAGEEEEPGGQQDIKNILLEETGEVKQDLIEIAARDVARDSHGEERLAKEKAIKRERFYSDLVFTLTNLRYDEQEARVLWVNLLTHKLEMSDQLDRNVGIRVAALDYFRNILGVLDDVKIMDASMYIETAQLAVTDGLTGIFNHRYFQDRLLRDINRAEEEDSTLSLLMIDIDFFKNYNDINGHIAGDVALKEVASVLRSNLKRDDLVARYGGEEFAVILVGVDKESAKAVAERIRRRVEEMEFPNEKVLPNKCLTISVGLATFPHDATERGALIAVADRALYVAKSAGKNCVEHAPTDQRAEIRLPLSLDLRFRFSEGVNTAVCDSKTSNLSLSGLCMLASQQLNVGQVLYLDLEGFPKNEAIMGRVMWIKPRPEGLHQVGVKFVNVDSDQVGMIRGLLGT